MSFKFPEYSFEPKGENYQIIVSYDFENMTEIKKIMVEEAKKSALMGMAFIHQLALTNNTTAKEIAVFYENYRHFFRDHNQELFLKKCQQILSDQNSAEIVKEMALYVQNLIKKKKTLQNEGMILIKNLIPFIKQTLLLTPPKVISKERIVEVPEMKAPHNAFSDLIKVGNDYYACFREAKTHGEYQDRGKIRILKGQYFQKTDEWHWENRGLLANEPYDLRDPKFFIDSENQLRLIADGSIINKENETEKLVPHIAYHIDGTWKVEVAIADKDQWIWRVTWNPYTQAGYGFSYGKEGTLTLQKTTDGFNYKKIADISTPLITDESLTEGTIRFRSNGSAVALIRTQQQGLIGTSNIDRDYTNWSFHVLPFRLGGPNFVFSKDEERMWAGTRYLFLNPDNTLDEATIIASMDERKLVPLLRLQGDLDSGYPGIVLEEDGSITVLYYSSELGRKSHIYVTRVMLPD